MKTLLTALILIASMACTSNRVAAPEACTKRLRAVIDLGSGTTKLTMGEVETCGSNSKLVRLVSEGMDRAVALEASKNKNDELSSKAMSESLNALNELRDEALRVANANGFYEVDLAVVATHAVRTARNREDFLQQVRNADFAVQALTQDEEGEAGFEAVRTSVLPDSCSPDKLLVWDVGGGSTQFVRTQSNKVHIVKYQLGAESYRKKLIGKWKAKKDSKCASDPESPNPLGKNLQAARTLIDQELSLEGVADKHACVVGIGGVHNKAVDAQIEKYWPGVARCACGPGRSCSSTQKGYSKKELECLAEQLAQKSDCAPELQGPYAKTAVSNLAMILGFMDALKIEQVHVMPINMGHYFVTDSKRLKFKTLKVN